MSTPAIGASRPTTLRPTAKASASGWAPSRIWDPTPSKPFAAREKLGRFLSIYEFCEHVDLSSINRRMIESLIRAGAMDSLEGTRAQLFAATESAMEAGQRVWRDRVSGQGGLFGD